MSHQAYAQQGMTLLEILVVLVITATLASLLVLNFNNSSEDELQTDAQRFTALLEQHCQDAMLLGQVRGLSLDQDGYQFWYRANQQWLHADSSQRLYRPRKWAMKWDLELSVNGLPESLSQDLNQTKQQPRLICMSDGLLPLFILRINAPHYKIPGLQLISAGGKNVTIETTL